MFSQLTTGLGLNIAVFCGILVVIVVLVFLFRTIRAMRDGGATSHNHADYGATSVTKLPSGRALDSQLAQAQGEYVLLLMAVDNARGGIGKRGVSAELARRIVECLSDQFFYGTHLFRLGNAEFALLMEHMAPEDAGNISRKLNSVMSDLGDESWGKATATLSIGVAFGNDSREGDDVQRSAQEALLLAQQDGGNCVRFS